MGYPTDLLRTRAVVRRNFAILDSHGFCVSTLPDYRDCTVHVLATPAMGANFAQYLMEAAPGGGTVRTLVEEGIERFLYGLGGEAAVMAGGQPMRLVSGGFAYIPPGEPFALKNDGSTPCRFLLVRRRYVPLGDRRPWLVTGHVHDLPRPAWNDMPTVTLQHLLPDGDLAFDLMVNVFTFNPGDSHHMIETHHETHGLYILSGQGMQYLGNEWYPVKAGDFIWMGPYVPQAFYCTGQAPASYIYTKEANREILL